MVALIVVRAVVFEPEALETVEASTTASGLARWLSAPTSQGVRIEHSLLRPRRLGFLVQRLPSEDVAVAWEPVLRVEKVAGYTLCRYHEGPPGEPWRHRYCTRPAVTRDGYCRPHSRSAKALYEKCAQGVEAACKQAEKMLAEEEYTIYALDYGGERLKIGMTQSWRLLWRIAEQPHAAAAAIASARGPLAARRMERELARRRGAAETGGRLETRLEKAARLLESSTARTLAERLASRLAALGLTGSYKGYTIAPRTGKPSRFQQPWAQLEALQGRTLRLRDYWSGVLLLEDTGTGEELRIPKAMLVHRALLGGVE